MSQSLYVIYDALFYDRWNERQAVEFYIATNLNFIIKLHYIISKLFKIKISVQPWDLKDYFHVQ